MSWRYQPVRFIEKVGDNPEIIFQLCEVYLDAKGRLEKWTDPPGICPSGEGTIDQLTGDLCRMLIDAYCWEPVNFQDMHTGMSFKRRATPKQREALARMVEGTAHNLREIGK
jgi:hypothetical protein